MKAKVYTNDGKYETFSNVSNAYVDDQGNLHIEGKSFKAIYAPGTWANCFSE